MLRLLYHIQNWLQKWFPSVMSPKQIAQWERVRSRGKARFVWRSTFIFGIWMFVFNYLFPHYVYPALFPQNSAADPSSVMSALTNLLICGIAGYLFGKWSWSDSEKRYLRSKDRQFEI